MTQNNPHPFSELAPAGAKSAPRCLLATSRLGSGASAADVSGVLKQARDRHRDMDITGMMLFDGERFAYLLSGNAAVVGRAFATLAQDRCLEQTVVRFDSPCIPWWAAQGWRSGWSEPDALLVLEAHSPGRNHAVLETWWALVGAGDLL